jgi:L-alanine-DL-glutamate epimerase-like enolase superfamily enzyme
MKVSHVEVVPLRVPLEEAHRPHMSMESIFPVVVRLYTDAGVDSFGVCFTFARQHSLVACIEDLKELVVGTKVTDSEKTWQQLYGAAMCGDGV